MEPSPGIKIAPGDLSPEALRGVVEEFVTRDGTNLAEGDVKVAQVMGLIERSEAEIWFDQATRTCNIVLRATRCSSGRETRSPGARRASGASWPSEGSGPADGVDAGIEFAEPDGPAAP